MPTEFLQHLSRQYPKLSLGETAVALLWFHGIQNPMFSTSVKKLADEIETAGHAKLNISRLRKEISNDNRTAKVTKDVFKIKIGARPKLDEAYLSLVDIRPIKKSNSVVPFELVKGTRGYIEKVTLQLNASYDHGLYDCCAVMCRRLLETMIIEVYEFQKREDKIKDGDGNYMMLSGLLNFVTGDHSINIGRNAVRGLKELKSLGDRSAHNRRFNARKSDVDQIKNDVRTSVEELLHLANLIALPVS